MITIIAQQKGAACTHAAIIWKHYIIAIIGPGYYHHDSIQKCLAPWITILLAICGTHDNKW